VKFKPSAMSIQKPVQRQLVKDNDDTCLAFIIEYGTD